jgi:hypothetical protein
MFNTEYLKRSFAADLFYHDETTITTFSRFAHLRLRRGATSIEERMTQILNGSERIYLSVNRNPF